MQIPIVVASLLGVAFVNVATTVANVIRLGTTMFATPIRAVVGNVMVKGVSK